ncbi:hypothetical protein B0E33_18695 [Roseibium algicola]|uniref:HTH gntR-type domain-containing protein n=1 Tax=Roseibium algicola TaxID=2857014 RepID=A0ABN4WUI1_9HYPH|nr:GntR family transcriptional regulator [Roseibium aggregatum]AQQ05355.1 hypothetical protein B0E33_18695 [Roseibium aggregatum]
MLDMTAAKKISEKPEFRVRKHLLDLVKAHMPGDRLPRVRDLMTRFHTSQRVVERAIQPLLDEGLISSRRGAGMHVGAGKTLTPDYRADCLILYRSSESRLARNLLIELVKRLKRSGLRVTMIGFKNEETAIEKMAGQGPVRCCLLQTNFEIVSVGFLARIRELTDHLVIDGVSVTGIDADVIGTNWREALSIAYRELVARGHRRIGFLTSSHDARQIAMARREFNLLANWKGDGDNPLLFQVPRLPGSYKKDDVVAALPQKPETGREAAHTALIVWGLVDGYLLDSALMERRLAPGEDIGVMLLGSVDVDSEHVTRFDTVGNRNSEKLDVFERVVRNRINDDKTKPATHYLRIHLLDNGSTVRREDA